MAQGLTTPISVSRGEVGAWLLDIDTGAGVLRFSSAGRVEVTNARGDVLVYRSGLQPLSVSIDPRLDAVSVEVVSQDVDWTARAARGRVPSRWTGELRHWYPGQTLEAARYVLRGRMRLPEYASPDNPDAMVCTIDASYLEARTMYPPESAVIDTQTWTDDRSGLTEVIESQCKGAVYTIPIGYPGQGDEDSGDAQPAVPVLVAALDGTTATHRGLLALGPIEALQARLWGPDDHPAAGSTWVAENEVITTAEDTDLLGQTVTYQDMTTISGNWALEEGKSYYVGFKNAAGHGGGVLWRGEVLRGLGDVVHWCLQNSGADADLDMVEGEREALNRYKVDTFLNTRLDLTAWLDNTLSRLFPLRRVRTGRGLYYRFQNWTPTRADATAVYNVARGDLQPVSPVRWSEPVQNKITLEYKLSAMNGAYYARRTMRAVAEGLGDQVVSAACAESESLYDLIEGTPIKTALLWSDATASRLLRDIAARDALPLAMRSYTAAKLSRHMHGDIIIIQEDLDISTEDQLGIIERVVIGSDLERIDVTILPPATRQTT